MASFQCDRCGVMCEGKKGLDIFTEYRPVPEERPVIYLSGRMTGLPDYGKGLFDKYAEKYRAQGFEVVSPIELDGGDVSRSYRYYLRRDLHALLSDRVVGIYMLPNWRESKGAKLEKHAAEAVGIPVFDAETGLNLADCEVTHGPEKARTYDAGKEPLAWLPWAALDELSKVQQYGHAKYQDFNNYRKGMEVSRNLSCALRHIRDYLAGQDVDAESGRNPLAHAMCRIAFVLQNIADGTAIDDRYRRPDGRNR